MLTFPPQRNARSESPFHPAVDDPALGVGSAARTVPASNASRSEPTAARDVVAVGLGLTPRGALDHLAAARRASRGSSRRPACRRASAINRRVSASAGPSGDAPISPQRDRAPRPPSPGRGSTPRSWRASAAGGDSGSPVRARNRRLTPLHHLDMRPGASFDTTEITPSAPRDTAAQGQRVVAGEDGEARRVVLRRSAASCSRFPAASLTPTTPAISARAEGLLDAQVLPRAAGHVVRHDREIDRRGDRREVREHARAVRLVVVRRDDEQARPLRPWPPAPRRRSSSACRWFRTRR